MAPRGVNAARVKRWSLRLLIPLTWLATIEVSVRVLATPGIAARHYCCTGDPTLCEIGQAYRPAAEFSTYRDQPGRVFGHDPALGHRLLPSVAPHDYKGGVLSTNALGARGPARHGYARVPGRARLVAVGDSYTMGQEVDDAEAWTARLEAADPSREVVNLGVSAYGVDQALLMLQREGMRYRPDTVLFGYFRDDLLRDMDRFACASKPYFAVEGEALVLRGVPVPTPEALRSSVRRSSVAWRLARSLLTRRGDSGGDVAASQALGLRLVREMARTAHEGGARLVIVHMPDVFAFRHPSGWVDPFLAGACAIQGVACVDPLPAMREAVARSGGDAQRAVFRQQHYNPEGNRIIAGVVDAWLRAHPR